MSIRTLRFVWMVIGLACAGSASAQTYHLDFIFDGALGIVPVGGRVINSSGFVAVSRLKSNVQVAAYWNGSKIVDLPNPKQRGLTVSCGANSINASGQVSGSCAFRLPDGSINYTRAAIWEGTRVRLLSPLRSYTSSDGTALNDAGQVVGASSVIRLDGSTPSNPVFWSAGQPGRAVDLGSLGGSRGTAFGINNAGAVVGYSAEADGSYQPYLWQNGTMLKLPSLGGLSGGVANAVNDTNQVVGSTPISAQIGHAALWQDGQVVDLGTLGAPDASRFSSAYGINNAGDIVGFSADNPNTFRATLWRNRVAVDLNSLIRNLPDFPDGVLLTWAYSINDLGQIVGIGSTGARSGVFVLTP